MYEVIETKTAIKDRKIIFKSHSKVDKNKLEQIYKELQSHPFEGIGNPEELKYKLTDYYSRELNSKDRIVYTIDEKNLIVTVYQCLLHYLDK